MIYGFAWERVRMESPYRSIAVATRRHPLFAHLAVFLSVIAGLTVSAALFFSVRAWDDARFQIAFERESREAISTLKEGIDVRLDVLRALKAFSLSSDSISRREFGAFAQDFLQRRSGFQAVEWIPKVPRSERTRLEEAARSDGLTEFRFTERDHAEMLVQAGAREDYYPVYYVEPYAGNESALGFDLGSDPLRREALLRCSDDGAIRATPSLPLVQKTEGQQGILVFIPVYRKGAPTDSPELRRRNLEGFYLAVIRVEDLLNGILSAHGFSGINLHVFDASDHDNKRLLYVRSLGQERARSPEASTEGRLGPGVHVAANHSFGGRTWTVFATPAPSLAATRRTWIPWLALAAGFVITVLTTTYLVQVQRGAETMRRHLEEQTRAREDLEREADKRTVAERTLRESEQKFKAIFENDHVIMLIFDPVTGRIEDAGPAACSFYGWSRDELKEKTIFDINTAPPDFVRERMRETATKRREFHDFQHRLANGDVRDVEVCAGPIEINGRTFICDVIKDITDRKRVHEQIEETNAELGAINGILSAISGFLDLQAVLEQVLDEAAKLVELEGGGVFLLGADDTLELAAHRTLSEAVVKDFLTRKIKIDGEMWGVCIRTLEPLILRNREELSAHLKRGSTREEGIHFLATFPLVTANRRVGVLCVFTKTDKRPSPQRLELLETLTGQVALAVENARLYEASHRHAVELEKTVAERTKELAVAKERAEAADRIKSAFLASMSHELRTPLNSIIGFTGIILQGLAGPLNPEQTKQLEMVRSSARHLLALINDVLDISKIEAGQLRTAAEQFDLCASINKVIGIVAPLAEKKALKLVTDIGADVREAVGDQRRVEQILLNLLNNAIKFTERGHIALRAEMVSHFRPLEGNSVAPAVRISVTDTGIGIKPEDMKTLFQPFRQVDSGLSRNFEGTGLGLAICRRLADLMGGEIVAESVWAKGSAFTLTLPTEGSKES